MILKAPGARSALTLARRAKQARRKAAERRQHAAESALVAEVAVGATPAVAILGPTPAGRVEAVRRAVPHARIVVVPARRRAQLAVAVSEGPFDVILDRATRNRRRRRFADCFFHLKPGGAYVVPGGAVELDAAHDGLGLLLARASEVADQPMRRVVLKFPAMRLLAVKKHVTARRTGPHLVLTHDLDDVLVKMRDSTYNQFLADTGSRHKVLSTIAAATPPQQPPGIEGPEPRQPPMHRPIERAELSLREYRDVVVCPEQIVRDGRILLPDTYRHNQWQPLPHLRLVSVAEDFAVARRVWPDPPRELEGTYLHLDNEVRGHFGHLLTESVSRFWTWEEALRIDPEVKVLVGATALRPELLPYELEVYEAGGIPADRIIVLDEPVQVQRLISGSPMFSHPQFVHPRIVDTWDTVGDRLAAKATSTDWPRRIFIGRETDKRACLNAGDVEAIFIEHGFEVVFPEKLSLGDQVQMFRSAEVIAGYAGSGLFQTMFVPEPTHVIQVCPASYVPRNEYLIAAVRGHRLDSIVSANEGKSLKASYEFDLAREGVFLRSLLKELPPLSTR